MMSGEVHYRRSRFSTRLLEDRLYTAGHSWLEREEGDLWRIGFTKFAVRMLGEIVELSFETSAGSPVETGQVLGWLEGFKAVTDLDLLVEEDIEAHDLGEGVEVATVHVRRRQRDTS